MWVVVGDGASASYQHISQGFARLEENNNKHLVDVEHKHAEELSNINAHTSVSKWE